MRQWERRLFNAATGGVAVTGFAYLWMKYFIQNDDPFALVNHPWQGAMLAWHVVASPLLILAFGIVLNSHVMKKLRVSGMPNRRTGFASLIMFALMVLSGYLLQVTTNESLIRALVVAHVGAGTIFSAAYTIHLVISWRLARRARRADILTRVA
ncbi:MAG: hypothetical protein ABMA15_21915 [Vicinamibacterales bacterium]